VARPFPRLASIPRDLALVLSLRLWQAGAGLITTLLAVHFLTPVVQGWYYSFISVAALYTLFDLGLSTVLVQVSAHAFAGLHWIENYRVDGPNQSYFEALLGRSARWYAIVALLFAGLLLPSGILFFGTNDTSGLHWVAPWLLLCSLTAAGLLVMPFMAILEGSGQIPQVYAVRLTQAVCGSIGCWWMFMSGAGLWATAMVPAMSLIVPLAWLLRYRRGLFVMAWHHFGRQFDWRREVWPLQWRLALNWLCGYLLTQINIPVLFHLDGPIAAGQLGLSLAIVNTLGLVAQAWIIRRVPRMARAVAVRDWKLLDQLFMRDFAISSAVFVAGAITVLVLDKVLLTETSYGHRLLPFWQLFGLLTFALCNHIIGALAAHLRSFRREPFMALITASTILAVPAILLATKYYSSAGMVAVLVVTNLAINLPFAILIWYRCNRIWRIEE